MTTTNTTWSTIADELQRIAVPGGWLYRSASWVELPSGSDEPNRGYWHWSDPVFVAGLPEPEIGVDQLTTDERSELLASRPISAIKMVRARLGIPLKDAKDIVDRARGK